MLLHGNNDRVMEKIFRHCNFLSIRVEVWIKLYTWVHLNSRLTLDIQPKNSIEKQFSMRLDED